MPRSRIKCQSCKQEIAGTQHGKAKELSFYSFGLKRWVRWFFHQACYERDNAKNNQQESL